MKLRYLFTALLFTGAAAPLQAQSIDHMRKLLQEIQQEIDCLEKEQAETLKPRKEPQPVESTEYGRRGDRRRHAPFGQRRSDDRPVQRQHMEIPPQPRLRQGQRNLHPLLGHDQTLSLPRRGEARRPAAFGGHRAGRLAQMLPLSLQGRHPFEVRYAPPAQASGRRPAR